MLRRLETKGTDNSRRVPWLPDPDHKTRYSGQFRVVKRAAVVPPQPCPIMATFFIVHLLTRYGEIGRDA